MILDSSVVLAILFREPGFEDLVDRIMAADPVGIGAPTLCEAGIVLTARAGGPAREMLDRFLQEFRVVEIPFGDDHWRVAVEAFGRFGKGRHPASLNFGDCMSYATARLAGRPLFYVGEDFSKTDLA